MTAKLFFLFFLALSFLAFIASCPAPTEPTGPTRVSATNIAINGGDFTTNNNISSTLTATILPTNHNEGNPVWTSSDTSKLTINSNTGDYSTIAPGKVRVTASLGTLSDTITITIEQAATNIAINGGKLHH